MEQERELEVSVVVTAVRDSSGLRGCLRRLRAQCAEAELVLAVNASAESFGETTRSALESEVDRIVFEPTPGKSHALNTAVEACRGEIVAFTDDDAFPCTDWLARIVAPLRSDAAIAGTGGPVLPIFPPGGPPSWYRKLIARTRCTFLGPFLFLGNEARDFAVSGDEISPVPFGANCAYRRELLLQHPYPTDLGPNRETGLRGGEDTAVAVWLLQANHRIVYVPDARVYHPVEPERLTLEFVRSGYGVQGLEYQRLSRHLGIAPETPKVIHYMARRTRGMWLKRRTRSRDRQIRRDLQATYLDALADAIEAGDAPARNG